MIKENCSFAEAIKALSEGCGIRRKDWKITTKLEFSKGKVVGFLRKVFNSRNYMREFSLEFRFEDVAANDWIVDDLAEEREKETRANDVAESFRTWIDSFETDYRSLEEELDVERLKTALRQVADFWANPMKGKLILAEDDFPTNNEIGKE